MTSRFSEGQTVQTSFGKGVVREVRKRFSFQKAKLLLLDLREVAKHENLDAAQKAVTDASLNYGNIRSAVIDTLRVAIEPATDLKPFVTTSLSTANFKGLLASPDQHRLEVVVDYGMAPRLSVTANAGIDLVDRKTFTLLAGTATSAGRIAAAMRLALDDAGVFGLRSPPTMNISTDIQWKSSEATYQA